MLTPIEGRSVIVTGGSKGIGKGIARVFAAKGAKVMIAARDEETGRAVAADLSSDGAQVEFCGCDVTDWDSVQRMMRTTVERFGGLDVLCANAGVYPQTRIEDMDPAEWDEVLSTNLKSTFLCVKAAIPHFAHRGCGRVILVSSITGSITGSRGWSHYGASKSGQLGFLRSASIELAHYKVTINAVLPGNIRTELLEDMNPEQLDRMTALVPLARLGNVADIAHAVLFFASDEAGYVTGQTLIVDGGQVLPESLEALDEF